MQRRTAVALRGGLPRGYGPHVAADRGVGPPAVVAAGQGTLADEIVRLAELHGVPVEHDPILAAALAQIEVGRVIPPELYQAIAELLVFLYDLDARQVDEPDPELMSAALAVGGPDLVR